MSEGQDLCGRARTVGARVEPLVVVREKRGRQEEGAEVAGHLEEERQQREGEVRGARDGRDLR